MTNKINGIDVSECFYFIDHTPPKGQGDWCGAIHKGACKVYSKDCEYNKDCYFKQLKRLQEENEELKENQCCPETCEYIATEIIRYTNVCEVNSKYKQALENIREMLKKSMSLKSNAYNHFINVEKAIDKINEVLNDRG